MKIKNLKPDKHGYELVEISSCTHDDMPRDSKRRKGVKARYKNQYKADVTITFDVRPNILNKLKIKKYLMGKNLLEIFTSSIPNNLHKSEEASSVIKTKFEFHYNLVTRSIIENTYIDLYSNVNFDNQLTEHISTLLNKSFETYTDTDNCQQFTSIVSSLRKKASNNDIGCSL